MASYISWALAGVLLVTVSAEPAETRPGQTEQHSTARSTEQREQTKRSPRKWWTDQPMRGELGITDQQSAAIEQIWQESIPKLREARDRLDQLETTLSQMILDASDEAAVVAQIERVENTRAEANKARTLMLYRLNRLLTPDQRVKLKAMHDRWEASRRQGPKGPPSDRREP
jgi:Spy/CpxP family protein refolding chaperone